MTKGDTVRLTESFRCKGLPPVVQGTVGQVLGTRMLCLHCDSVECEHPAEGREPQALVRFRRVGVRSVPQSMLELQICDGYGAKPKA